MQSFAFLTGKNETIDRCSTPIPRSLTSGTVTFCSGKNDQNCRCESVTTIGPGTFRHLLPKACHTVRPRSIHFPNRADCIIGQLICLQRHDRFSSVTNHLEQMAVLRVYRRRTHFPESAALVDKSKSAFTDSPPWHFKQCVVNSDLTFCLNKRSPNLEFFA